jgi:hypothetical protein
LATYKLWSSKYNWQERVKEYDRQKAEEKRRAREAAREEMNERHAALGMKHQQRALEHIERLIESKRFGSQAAVTLYKYATDFERLARGEATSIEHQQHSGPAGGPIAIQHVEYGSLLAEIAGGSAEDSDTPGEDEGFGDGTPLGEDTAG